MSTDQDEGSDNSESHMQELHEIEENLDLLILDLGGQSEKVKRTLREATDKLHEAREMLKGST